MKIIKKIKEFFSNEYTEEELYERERKRYINLWYTYRNCIMPIIIDRFYSNKLDENFHDLIIGETDKIVEIFVRNNYNGQNHNDFRDKVIKEILDIKWSKNESC